MPRRRHPERWLLGLSVLLVLAVGLWVLVAGHVLPVAGGEAAGFSYRVLTRADGDGTYLLVSPVPRNTEDFSAYKAANDARLAGPPPSAAVDIAAIAPVALTFRRPLGVAELRRLLGADAPPVASHILVGRSEGGLPASEERDGPPDPGLVGVPRRQPGCVPDPAPCQTVTYHGVIQVQLRPAVDWPALARLAREKDVYLADGTGLAALAALAATRPDLARAVRDVYLPKVVWTRSGEVRLP